MGQKRKPRGYERTCTCRAYPFPHRLLGGRCTGRKVIAIEYYNNQGGSCSECTVNDYGQCQVLTGQESERHAPCLQEFIQFEGVRPPVAWRDRLTYHKAAA